MLSGKKFVIFTNLMAKRLLFYTRTKLGLITPISWAGTFTFVL